MKSKEDIYIKIYRKTEEYLKSKCDSEGIELKKYYVPLDEYNIVKNPNIDEKTIFKKLIGSLNNRGNGKARLVSKKDDESELEDEKVKKVLKYFDFRAIYKIYGDKDEEKKLANKLINNGGFSDDGNTIKYAHGICSAAELFCETDIIKEIREKYKSTIKEILKLVNILEKRVYNMGYALACDFLKEIGYTSLVKPDTHILSTCGEILKITYNFEYNVNPTYETCQKLIEKIVEVNKKIDNKLTCYKLDKMFWLIGSSKFYLDKNKEEEYKHLLSKKDFFNNYLTKIK